MNLTPLLTERLQTTIAIDGNDLRLTLAGTADLEAKEPLFEWLAEVHESMKAKRHGKVIVSLRQLEFMSSMCVNVLVGWLVAIMELPHEQQYGVHIRWNKHQLWQRRSVLALRRFAPRIVQTEPAS